MIIWRGWGVLAFLVTGLCVVGLGELGESMDPDGPLARAFLALGFLAAGAANWFLGRYLNMIRPQQQGERYQNLLRAQLWQRVNNGVFQMAPGAPAPTSQAEATQQIEQLVAQGTEGQVRAHSNVHTLFFIPIQWLGLIEVAGGLVLLVVSVVEALR